MIKNTRVSELADVLIFVHFLWFCCQIVCYVLTVTFPTHACNISIFHRISKWPHSFIVCTIWLHKVTDMESIFLSFTSVLDSEIVPLTVTLG